MKLKKKIKKLETEVSELRKQIQMDSIRITDSCNSNLKAVIGLRDGQFLIEKITTTLPTDQTSEIILKDNK